MKFQFFCRWDVVYSFKISYDYEFDQEGYVIKISINYPYELIKEDYEIHVGNEPYKDCYLGTFENVRKTVLKSATDTHVYEIEYL